MADGDQSNLPLTRIFLRPIANPFALGFLGLAGASVTAATLDLRWASTAERTQAALIILVAAPLPQLVSSVFGFLGRDPLAAGGMGWLSAAWLANALVLLASPPGSTSVALGAFMVTAGAGILLIGAESLLSKVVPAVVIGLAGTRFVLGGIYQLAHVRGWQVAAGVVGVAVTVSALYAVASLALEDVRRRTVLPTLRRGEGAEAMTPELARQVRDVAAEAGVRKQL